MKHRKDSARLQRLCFVLSGAFTLSSLSVWAADDVSWSDIRSALDTYKKQYNNLSQSLDDMSDEADTAVIRGKSDRQLILKHYNGLRQSYLQLSLEQARTKDIEESANQYAELTEASYDAFNREFVNKFAGSKENFFSCMQGKRLHSGEMEVLKSAGRTLTKSFDAVKGALAVNYRFDLRRTQTVEFLTDKEESSLDAATEALERNWKSGTLECCTKAISDPAQCKDLIAKTYQDDSAGNPMRAFDSMEVSSLYRPAPRVPDPKETTNLTTVELAGVLAEVGDGSSLRRIRSNDNLHEAALEEEDLFSSAENDCRQGRAKKQENSHPVAKKLGSAVAELGLCIALPAYGAMNLDTEYQRMTTAAGRMIDFKGNGWGVKCDPKMMDFYDSQRSTDPNVIANNNQINQNMSNPPWIGMLRSLPPVQSPFPMVGIPGAGVITPYGTVGRGLSDGNDFANPGAIASAPGGGILVNRAGGRFSSEFRPCIIGYATCSKFCEFRIRHASCYSSKCEPWACRWAWFNVGNSPNSK